VAFGADGVSLAPREGVLLLNNGEVVEGLITAAGDRYDVVRKDVEIRIKRSEVAIVCQDLQECYLHKRSGIEQGRVQDHLELAEWCLKNSLVEPAEKELEAARAADPEHPRIRLLEPRLELARQVPKDAEPVQPGEKAVAEALDTLVRGLPAGSMEHFTNGIQPMLLNYCAKSGCHGPRSSGPLKLERIPPNRLAGRHATQGNLRSALAMVDRDSPQESKLLLAPIRRHGTMKTPVFTHREQSQYKQLVEWVYLISNVKEAAPQPTLEERAAPLLQTVPRGGKATGAATPPQAKPVGKQSPDEPASWSDSFPDQVSAPVAGPAGQAAPMTRGVAQTEPNAVEPGANPKRSVPEAQFVPKDPFDPAIFNRRFFGR
jgi:hypothetical protein